MGENIFQNEHSESESERILPEVATTPQLTMRQRLGAWDKSVSRRVYNASYHQTRFLLYFLELSGHGMLWLVIPAVWYLLISSVSASNAGILLNYLGVAIVDLLVIAILKPAVGRRRPEHNAGMTAVTIHLIDQYSFPSGHATRAGLNAAFVAYLQAACPEKLSLFARSPLFLTLVLIWAAAVAVSRVSLGRHHVLDVCAGLVLGVLYVISWQMFWISDASAMTLRKHLRDFVGLH